MQPPYVTLVISSTTRHPQHIMTHQSPFRTRQRRWEYTKQAQIEDII